MKSRKSCNLAFCALVIAAITLSLAVCCQAQTESVLYSFTGNNGEQPQAGMIFDSAGNLYGTTNQGGGAAFCASGNGTGCGVVFKFSRDHTGAWKESVLHSFIGGRTGDYPVAGVVRDSVGNLYGTTRFGGTGTGCGKGGCGIVYELSPTTSGPWRETVLHTFTGGTDGGIPTGGLILDTAGNLYGNTTAGGNSSDCTGNVYPGCGVSFELSPMTGGGWQETVLYTFTGGNDGGFPAGALVFDAVGNLYGAASLYGAANKGTIFELSPSSSGWAETTIYTFTGAPDGYDPIGNLIFDSAGNLYGTTYYGGNGGGIGSGTVFELSPSTGSWTETILFNFNDGTLGGNPLDGVMFDSAGNLYGTTSGGGPSGHMYGLAFELSQSSGTWSEKVLHNFSAQNSDGQYPYGALVFDKVGNLYGTTSFGGSAKQGTIFKIAP